MIISAAPQGESCGGKKPAGGGVAGVRTPVCYQRPVSLGSMRVGVVLKASLSRSALGLQKPVLRLRMRLRRL
jgi:hypothetical protein